MCRRLYLEKNLHELHFLDGIIHANYFFSGPVTEGFAFVGDIKFIALCTLGYIYMCAYGPKYMSSRKEFHLKPVMQVYNLFMIFMNAYVLEEVSFWPKKNLDFKRVSKNKSAKNTLLLFSLTSEVFLKQFV